MAIANIERDSETIVDFKLKNLNWSDHPHDDNRTVWKQGVKTDEQRKRLGRKRPDYTYTPADQTNP